jgi:hypothetical protein
LLRSSTNSAVTDSAADANDHVDVSNETHRQ